MSASLLWNMINMAGVCHDVGRNEDSPQPPPFRRVNSNLQPLVRSALRAIGQGSIVQDDNARPHLARDVNDFLQQLQVTQMDWPALSADLNPIFVTYWELPPAVDIDELFAFEWQAFPQMTLQLFDDYTRTRCLACIRAILFC